ncbi:MAG: hypothetical protein LBP26_04295 [Clostridiales bacterium]|nr:hypothetical protein [Clostridiales bacterium]
MPLSVITGVPAKELDTVATANKALAPYSQAIQDEARGGWTLHSITPFSAFIVRKKGILEILLGWIPVIGFFFKPKNLSESDPLYPHDYMALVFSKEN